ncbi:hypothetical protein JX266_011776 [Neoarthrinium moseri]|nr:hypothetical protein JX266_011776 [Neoarthrinium moseri]
MKPSFGLGTLLLDLLLGTALASQKVMSGGRRDPLDADFEKLAVKTLKQWHVPGLAIAVVDGDDTWAAGYGNASIGSTPVTPSTLFYSGSTTKAFTAAVLSLLVDSDAHPGVTWRTPISQLIRDDFVLQPEYAWAQEHLTIEDALTHRTGFPRHDKSLPARSGPDAHVTAVRDITRSLRDLPMVLEPRTRWKYCNLMFMVLSHAIQELTRRWLGDVMREWIWEPLGMRSTYFSLDAALEAPEDLARGYYWEYKDQEGGYKEVPWLKLQEASGAGAVVSNVLDYAKWIRCLVNEAAPLSKEGHKAIRTPRMVPSAEGKGLGGPSSYALGWHTNTYKGHRMYTHSGGMEAYGADVFFFPDLKYGIVAMGNTAITSNFAGRLLTWKLINDRLGIPESERYDWSSQFEKALNSSLEQFDKAIDKLYPGRANPALPRGLELKEYTGTYSHPAYHDLTIDLGDDPGRLRAVRVDFVWPMTFDFVHVSGEYWVIHIDMKNSPNALNGQSARAEFKIGPNGKCDQVLIEFLEDGSEGVIPFTRATKTT